MEILELNSTVSETESLLHMGLRANGVCRRVSGYEYIAVEMI